MKVHAILPRRVLQQKLLAEVELLIGATRLELTKLTGFGAASPLLLAVPLPKAVDPGAAEAAKFSRKTGQLRVRLRVAR